MAILNEACDLAGISNADLGAKINESADDVRRILMGAKPLTEDHHLRVGRRDPKLWAFITARTVGRVTAEHVEALLLAAGFEVGRVGRALRELFGEVAA